MLKNIIIASCVVLIASLLTCGYYLCDAETVLVDTYLGNFKENFSNLQLYFEANTNVKKKDEIIEEPQKEEKQENKKEKVENKKEDANTLQETQEKYELNVNDETQDESNLPKKFELIKNPIACNGAGTAKYARYNDCILCVRENVVDLYKKNGEIEWSINIQISNPVVKVCGDYIFLFEQNGTKLALYKNNKEVFLATNDTIIKTGNVSSDGDCCLICDKEYYKGAAVVYNKSGEKIFERCFGSENVISVAISKNRNLAVSLLTANEKLISRISVFDINKKDSGKSIDYEDTLIFDLDYSQGKLIAYGDNRIVSINPNAKEIWKYEFLDKTLSYYSEDNSGVRALLFDDNNNPEINILTSSGNKRPDIITNIVPDSVDIFDGNIIYNNERNLYLSKNNGKTLAKYATSRDIKQAYFIDSDNILVVYNQSLEFMKIKRS